MTTLVGFRCADGAVVAGDRTIVDRGSIRSSDRQRVYGFDGWGIAVLGDDVDGVRDRVDAGVREYRTGQGDGDVPTREPLGRIAADVVEEFDAALLAAGHDDGGTADVVAVREDGSRIEDSPSALGSGTELAIGRLEAADTDVGLAEAEALARDVIEGVAERDTGTDDDTDVWSLADE